jgi:hypothetical protein
MCHGIITFGEMSKQGTWCDNVIIQAVANALSCIIHITDSNPNTINATIVAPVNNSQHNQITVFLGYIIDVHYVSTSQETCNENAINLTSLEKKLCTRAKMLANKRKFAKTKRVNECNDAKQARLARKRECDKSQRATETIDEKKVQLAKKGRAG